MPRTTVYFFQDADGRSTVVSWLESLRETDEIAYARCVAVIERLAEAGYELRRPTADMLRDGIYELRARMRHVNYRLLYFFHGRNVAIVAHALTKKDVVPAIDIERALARKRAFEAAPNIHTYERHTR